MTVFSKFELSNSGGTLVSSNGIESVSGYLGRSAEHNL